MARYHVFTIADELPPTKTYPKPGQRLFYLKAPGVFAVNAEGEAVAFCLFDVDILQAKGSKEDQEAYHVKEFDGTDPMLDVRNLPRDPYGRPAQMGYLFVCYTSEPTPDRPGIYRVACGADGRAYWCECLGAKGHRQDSRCKHRDLVTHLAERSPVDRSAQVERAA